MSERLRRFFSQHGVAVGAALALAALVLGAKWQLIRHAGSDVPYMDQWDAEALVTLIPAVEHRLGWEDLWWAHNEHRIVWTKLLALGLAWANRQWDPILEVTVNALLHTGLAILLLGWARRLARGLAWGGLALLTAALFALPYAWENTLQGFQSQFYFLALFTLGFLRVAVPARNGGGRWWLGLALGVATIGTMSSGFMAAVAALLTLAVQAACARTWDRGLLWRGLALGGLGLAGLLAISPVPGHSELRVASLAEFWRELQGTFGWPTPLGWWAALLLQTPLVVFAGTRWRARRLEGEEAVLFAFGAWTAMQTLALAFARGHLGAAGSPRYADVFALGVVANALALTRAWPTAADGWRRALVPVWIGLVAYGLHYQVSNWQYFTDELPEARAAEKPMLRRFLATGDIAVIRQTPSQAWPHPTPETLAGVLLNADFQRLLPPSLRRPVPLAADAGTHGFGPPTLPTVEAVGEPDTPVWQAEGPARFVSRPLPADVLPILRLSVRGDRELPTGCLRLEAEDGTCVPLALTRFAGDRWQNTHLPVPVGKGEVRLVAEIPPGGKALGFAAPIELGRGSYVARQALKSAATLLWTGGIALLVAVVALAWREPPTGGWRAAWQRRRERGQTWRRGLSQSGRWARGAFGTVRQWGQQALARWAPFFRQGLESRRVRVLAWAVLGAALFLRKPDALLVPQFWAEDGDVFLRGHALEGWRAWWQPYAGYLHLLPRLVISFACQFDPELWPHLAALASFAIWWAVIGRCWSPRLELPGKVWLPLPLLVGMMTAEILFNATNLQWITSLMLVQQLFLRPPRTAIGYAGEAVLMIVLCLTGPFCVLLWPVFAWEAWRQPREPHRLLQGLIVTATAAVQLWMMYHYPSTLEYGRLGPMEFLKLITAGGQRLLILFLNAPLVGRLPAAVWLLSGLGLGVLVLWLWLRLRLRPRRVWGLATAVLILLFGAGLLRSRLDQVPLDWIGNADRYYYAPRVLLGWMLIWAATQEWPGRRVARLVAVIALLAHLPTYRMGPYPDLHWARYAEKIRQGEAVDIPVLPDWTLNYPARPKPPTEAKP